MVLYQESTCGMVTWDCAVTTPNAPTSTMQSFSYTDLIIVIWDNRVKREIETSTSETESVVSILPFYVPGFFGRAYMRKVKLMHVKGQTVKTCMTNCSKKRIHCLCLRNQLSSTSSNVDEVYLSATSGCTRPEPATENGIADGWSNTMLYICYSPQI